DRRRPPRRLPARRPRRPLPRDASLPPHPDRGPGNDLRTEHSRTARGESLESGPTRAYVRRAMRNYSALLKWSAPTVVIAVACALAGTAVARPAHHTRAPGRGHSGGAGPGKPIAIGLGFRPQVLVDDAGVAHITYSSPAAEHGPAGEHTY